MFALDGQVAVVTGASRGLGESMARKLAEVGAHVVLVSRSADKLEETAADIRSKGQSASAMAIDCQDEAAVGKGIAAIAEEHGRLDILVNNAGAIMRKPVTETTAEEWHGIVSLNLDGAFFMAREAAKIMVSQGRGGRIINTLSALSVFGRAGVHAYTASKHALLGLTKSMAAELGPKGITVNGIGPGYMKTENTAPLQATKSFDDLVRCRTPVGRWGEPQDMDAAVVFLCSPMAGYVNGHMLMVDGGFTTSVCTNEL